MIVRNEAHIIEELIASVAGLIDCWVIVDTGSDDGTQELIRRCMKDRRIPGELHERPWRNFGENRSEALALAQGHADYIWVMDADDVVIGEVDFAALTEDAYEMRFKDGLGYWRRQLFRDGLPWRYEGVLHEFSVCDAPFAERRLEGDYHIHSRRLGSRSRDPGKYRRDAEILQAEVDRDPDNARNVFYLAQSYFDAGDYAQARRWYERRAEMGGWKEEVFVALYRSAGAMERLGESWASVQERYLQAWNARPCRAEPLHAIARHYRMTQVYPLGLLFAQCAAQLPLPAAERLFVPEAVYNWQSLDEWAVCASWLGRWPETFAICRQLLERDDIPEADRARIASNRDMAVPHMLRLAAASTATPPPPRSGPGPVEITLTLLVGADPAEAEASLNTFLQTCLDAERIGRFLVFDTGLSWEARFRLLDRYRCLEFVRQGPLPTPRQINSVMRGHVEGRYWLHLERGWRFFAQDRWISRLIDVLDSEPGIVAVGLNRGGAPGGPAVSEAVSRLRRTAANTRYQLAQEPLQGPVMVDLARFDADPAGPDQGGIAPSRCATLDEILCVSGGSEAAEAD